MKTISTPASLYRFLRKLLDRDLSAYRIPKKLAKIASHLLEYEMPGCFDLGPYDKQWFSDLEDDLDHELATPVECICLRALGYSSKGTVMYPRGKLRVAMWMMNELISNETVNHLDISVAIIRYLLLDRQGGLRYSHRPTGLRVTSGKEFEHEYGVRVRVRRPNNCRS
jgi:hypothetical protein